MKFFTSLFVCLLLMSATFAQIKVPQIDRVQIDKKHYFQTYSPKGLFSEQFPNFMNDGKYRYNSIFPDHAVDDPEFSEKDYPADVVSTNNVFKGIKKVYVRYCSLTGEYPDTTNVILRFFKKQLEERGVSAVTTENLKETLTANPNFPGSDNDLIIDIDLVYGTTGRQYTKEILSKADTKRFNDGEFFPKFRLYKMTIRNRLGEKVKAYSQAIFVNAYITGIIAAKKSWKVWADISDRCALIAANSLVSRFLNDDVAVDKVYAENKSIGEKVALNNDYNRTANLTLKLNQLDYWKPLLLKSCEDLKVNFNDFSKYVDSHKNNQPTFVPSALNSAQTNQVASSVNALGTSIVSGIFDRQIENMHKETLAQLKNNIAKYDRDMREALDDITALPPSADKNELIARIQKSNPDLSGSLQDVLDADQKSNESMAAAKTERNALLDNLNSTLQSLQNGKSQTSSAAITSSNKGTAVDECSTQATAAWKGSAEYRTYLRTKLNADMKDCQAKLIELTLQYCSSKLSPQEIATDKKAASEARQDARDMRKATPNIKL